MNMVLAGLAILLIGDSHIAAVGYFNNPLHEGLIGQGASVDTFGVCNSLPDDWITPKQISCGRGERHNQTPAELTSGNGLRGWALASLISRYKPNLVVIEMGDTLAGYGAAPQLPRDFISKQVTELLQPIKSQKLDCIWIGPPWGTEGGAYKKTFTRVKELSDYLSQIVTPCRYVDSLLSSPPGRWPTIDGVHLTPASTRLWDAYVIQSISNISSTLLRH